MTVCLGLGISPGLFLLRLLCHAALDSGNRKCYNVHEKQSAPDVRQGSDKMRILMIEDDPGLVKGLSFAVKKQGYELDTAKTKSEAEKLWRSGNYGLIIIDVELPDGSGFDVCEMIRRTSKVPIIFLTAADEETDIIMGLDMGGDDYIIKPFKLAVLMSRINALLRRSGNFGSDSSKLESNGIVVDRLGGKVYKNGVQVSLTAGEYRLLCMLMENAGAILSHEKILARLWDCDENYVDANTLTVYIRRLREKIEDDPGKPARIVTVRRMGYKWNTEQL